MGVQVLLLYHVKVVIVFVQEPFFNLCFKVLVLLVLVTKLGYLERVSIKTVTVLELTYWVEVVVAYFLGSHARAVVAVSALASGNCILGCL